MMFTSRIKYILMTYLLIACVDVAGAQVNIKEIYDNVISGDGVSGFKSVRGIAEQGNSKYFIIMSTFVDANNMMYLKTKDAKYLGFNSDVIKRLKNSGQKGLTSNGNVWISKFSKNESNGEMNGKEFMLFEGYLYRYIAEYYYIIKSNFSANTVKSLGLDDDVSFVENNFMKWYKRSMQSKGDDSYIQGNRVHMGAQWASAALYLTKISNNADNITVYKRVASRFDDNLRVNLKLIKDTNNLCYEWSDVWKNNFTNSLRSIKTLSNGLFGEVQDVSHGNHVVEYVISSYDLGFNKWSLNDLAYFSNTLKYKIWNQKLLAFSDLVDGTNSNVAGLRNTGWKQSDGWMKLIKYDSKLKAIYMAYFMKNRPMLENTNSYPQFLANLM